MDPAQLLEDLTQNLVESDLRTFCGRLGVNYAELAGYNLHDKAQRLIVLFDAQERLSDLVGELIRIRPYLAGKYDGKDGLSWLDQVGAGMGQATPAQITASLAQLRDFSDADALAYTDRATSKSLQPALESPMTRRRIEDPPLAHPPTKPTPALPTPPGVRNPYHVDGPVLDPKSFFGRADARRQLRSRLQNMGSSAIIGFPQMGKSSLLHYLSHYEPFDAAWRFLFADVELKAQRFANTLDLLNKVLQKWYEGMGQSHFPTVDDLDGFVRQVRFLGQSGYRPVLCLDDFDVMLERPFLLTDDLLEAWLTLGNAGRLAFVVTVRRPLVDIMKTGGFHTGLTSIFAQVDLDLLPQLEAQELVQKPALQQGVTIAAEVVADLLQYCGRHPRYLQLASYYLFPNLWRQNGITDEIRAVFWKAAVPYWQELWAHLTPLQQSVLVQPLQADAPLVVSRQYRILVRYGVLVEVGESYQLFSDAFAEWLRQR